MFIYIYIYIYIYIAILKESSLWVVLSYMVVATYCYYKKELRTMHTSIVLYHLKKESELNEVC